MLYIKFQIEEATKYNDFVKLYNHLEMVRQPGFEFEDEVPEFDWDNMNENEVNEALKLIDESLDEELVEYKRYQEVIPEYANLFFEKYLKLDNDKLGNLGIHDVLSIFNYLEFGFEVELDTIKKIKESLYVIEFSTGNYPFGGLERFLITLKAYNLIPLECFDGFSINEIKWNSDFEYSFLELKKQTEVYLKKARE